MPRRRRDNLPSQYEKKNSNRDKCQQRIFQGIHRCAHGFECGAFHGRAAFSSCAGGGKIGGLSVEVSFFCTSISEIKMAGAAAATGTDPDSAPQYPLNTSIVSPVATIFVRETRGVPTISTPRTNSSRRPSANTLYTTRGCTWKACGRPA